MLKGGLVGFGAIAQNAHVPAFAKYADRFALAAVAEGDQRRLEEARKALPQARLYSSMDAMLDAEKDLAFVDICTPPHLHAPLALSALKRGLHVLCEKPLCLSIDDLGKLKLAAAQAGRALFTVHNWAYSPQWLKVRELLGRIEPLHHASIDVLRTKPSQSALPGDWRKDPAQAGGGIMVDHGWHNLYLLLQLAGGRPTRVMPKLFETAGGGVDEEAVVFFEFPAATALLHMTWRSSLRANSVVLYGGGGRLALRDDAVELATQAGVERFEFPEALSAGSAHPEWLAALLPDFEQAAAGGAARARNLDEASFCAEMTQRIYHSHKHGRNPMRENLQRPPERLGGLGR